MHGLSARQNQSLSRLSGLIPLIFLGSLAFQFSSVLIDRSPQSAPQNEKAAGPLQKDVDSKLLVVSGFKGKGSPAHSRILTQKSLRQKVTALICLHFCSL
jgi:hypothetical protein